MNPLETIQPLFVLSALGLLGLSVLFPLLAWPGYYFRTRWNKKSSSDLTGMRYLSRVDILIPAHNEALTLGKTLQSIQRAIRRLYDHPQVHPWPEIRIHVGADSCDDATVETAAAFLDVTVNEYPHYESKWLTLKSMALASSADWLILVDAGTLWPEDFLLRSVPEMQKTARTLALSPAYQPCRADGVHRAVWKIEAFLKRLEVYAGGPVSVHGATVCYKTEPLQRVFQELGATRWLNDDVAIPLFLRTLYPEGRILYPVGSVQDAGVDVSMARDLRRRSRILQGNLQWAGALLPYCYRRNPVAGLVATRRLFRMFWAYWLALPLVTLALAFHMTGWFVALAAIVIFFSKSLRQFAAAAWISLLAPFRILQGARAPLEAWK